MVFPADSDIPCIFDRALYLRRRAKASAEIEGLVAARLADELADRVALITRHFGRALLTGMAHEQVQQALRQSGKIGTLDIAAPASNDDLGLAVQGYDAVFSVCDLSAVNDVPGQLVQMARALRPDGLLMVAMFAGETLAELREVFLAAEDALAGGATPRVAPMVGLRELGGLLQRAGLALPVADLDHITLRYHDPLALMRDIKAAGFGNVLVERSRKLVSRRLLLRAAEFYVRDHADADGKVRATIDIAWANGWKPHESQPKPLKPGSGKVSLADVLKPGG